MDERGAHWISGLPGEGGYYPSPDATPCEGLVVHLLASLVMKLPTEGLFTSVYAPG